MANVAALKKKAIDFESKKQFDKAIAAYREVLDAYDSGDETDVDVTLYNRVGDLLVRQGNNPEAVTLYERAVDLYTEGGFFNNAIALCNKVLRASPGRASIYYKLGKISAAKGFKAEAKQNFLEYADRMQRNGKMDEAFRALKEFADLVPDQDDVRLMLAEQLTKAGNNAGALEQLEALYRLHDAAGRTGEMQAALKRMKAIDPSFEPKASEGQVEARSDDLIFIDLDTPPKRGSRTTGSRIVMPPHRATQPTPPPPKPPPQPPPPPEPERSEPEPPMVTASLAGAAEPDAAPEAGAASTVDDEPVSGPERLFGSEAILEPETAVPSEVPPEPVGTGDAPALEIMEIAMEGAHSTMAGRESVIGLEPTSFADTIPDESEPMDANEFDEIDLDAIPEAKTGPTAIRSDLALGGDLPPFTSPPRISGSLIELDDAVGHAGPMTADVAFDAPLGVEATTLVAGAGGAGGLDLLGGDTDPPASPVSDAVETALPDEPSHFDEVEADIVDEPPPVRRSSTLLAANTVLTLRVQVADAPEDWALHRRLGEALLDAGERDDGIKELEAALAGFDKTNNLDNASSIADEIVRIDPSSVRYHQKRVEYAFRANDKARTADAYLALADALLRNGQTERARTVYQRILELAPSHAGATAALESLVPAPEPAPVVAPRQSSHAPSNRYTGAVESMQGGDKRYTGAVESVMPMAAPDAASGAGDDAFVSLGDWLRKEEGPKSTRMIVQEQEPTGDEQADFADMLRKFKQGISENVEEEDHEAHYDLGVAYKEMGLLDEAIAEFQKALRGTEHRARTYEALGQCFLEKKQLAIATTILKRALSEPGIGDEQLVGVLYLLGYVHEAQGKHAEAKGYYERVFGVDIEFRDVGDRLTAVDQALE